jgi:putative two-component system response regulator
MSESNTTQQTQELDIAIAEREVALLAITSLIDTHGNTQSLALRRKQGILAVLIRELQKSPDFASSLSDAEADIIIRASPLQDIGKSGIPDRILLKPGKLTQEEFDLVKTHPTIAFEALQYAEKALGKPSAFLRYAKEIAYCHQEKWDGTGYPRQLAGKKIPLAARLAAIVDVYNAITSKRVYKAALSHDEAIQIIQENRGISFDPQITDAFVFLSQEILATARKFAEKYDEQAEIRRLESAVAEAIDLS